jgi:hypothetical protein
LDAPHHLGRHLEAQRRNQGRKRLLLPKRRGRERRSCSVMSQIMVREAYETLLAGNVIPKSSMTILHVKCSYIKLVSNPQYIREDNCTTSIMCSVSINQDSLDKLTFPSDEVKDPL